MEILAVLTGAVSGVLAYTAGDGSDLPGWAQWLVAFFFALPSIILIIQRLIEVIVALIKYVKALVSKDSTDDAAAEKALEEAEDELKEAISGIVKKSSESSGSPSDSSNHKEEK